MFNPNKLKRNLNMKKSIIILVFVVVLSQLGNASSTIDNVPSITGKNALPESDIQANTINLEDDAEKNKKPVVLLVPVESSEEIYDSHDEEGEEEETTEEVEDVTHHNHKTKRCKSPNSYRSARRIPLVKDARKYISASTESSIDESVENPIGGSSLFRVASVKDAKKILKSLLKSRSTNRDDDSSLERVSKPHNQDSIKLVSKNSDRQGHRPKKYVCYCVEEDCGMKKPGKKPSRTYAVKKRIGPNALGKSSTNYEDQDLRGSLHSGDVVGAPKNLHCPPGAILMEEPEYLAQLAMKREKQNLRNRPVKNCPETIFPPDSEAYSLGQPTKIHIPLAGNRKWNRRVYKVDKKSPFAQKLQSVFEQREAQERAPCPEPETTYNDAQGLQDYYNNEPSNYNQYNQIPVAPNLVYPGPYVVYPQYPQYPQYGDGLHNPIPMEPMEPMEPPGQDYVSHQEPLHDPYVPTPLGRNFIDINQCIKVFGPNFCIVTTTTISPIAGPHYASNCGEEHEEPGILAQWQDDSHYTTKIPQQKTSKYPTNAYNADEATTRVHGLGVTRHHEENSPRGEEYPEDDSEHEYGSRISSGHEYDRVTASPYGTWQTPNYENIGSQHEEHDYGDYENFVDPESPIRHDHTNFEYLIPIEDSDDLESADYLGSSEETNDDNVLQKIAEENVTEGPVVAVTKKLQGAHKMSSPQYVQYTVKPAEGVTTSSSEDTSDETFEDTSDYFQATQNSRLFDYDRSGSRYSTSESSNEESVESSTEFPSHSVFSTIDRPEDESRSTLLTEGQGKNKLPGWQRVTTMYPIIADEDRTASNHAGANFEPHIPKTTNSHRQFVGITQTTPVNHYSEPKFVSSTTIDGKNYYASSHGAEDEAEDATTSWVAASEPQEPTYTSATYSEINDAEEMRNEDEEGPQEFGEDEENSNKKIPTTLHYTTESRLGDTVNKYSTTKSHSSFQSKQPKSNSVPAAGQMTTSYENLVGRSQSTPMDNSAKPGFVSSVTVDGDNRYTTSYATTTDSKYGTTSLLRANEPEEQEFSSTIYPNMESEEMRHDSPGYEETSVKTPSSLYTLQTENGEQENRKYITTEKTFYPQGGSYQTTFFDSSTQPEQVGDSFETSKISSHQPFVESNTQFTSSDSFEEPEDISTEATSYATFGNSEYDTTPLLGENEPEENVYTTHLPYSTTVIDENRPTLSRQQVAEEHDEVSTEKIPASLHYTTDSDMAGMDQNKWTNAEEATKSHRQFVGRTQSTPVNDFSQSGEASSTTIGDKNYYTTSYATMKDTDDSTTSVLGAEEPEEEVSSPTNYPWPRENEEKNHDNIEQTTRTQYYPTQSEMQETSMDQHFTTDQNSHPQFVGSHQSTVVDSSTQQDQLGENFETHKTSTYQPFVESIGQSTSSNDFAKSGSTLDAAISYATMANSKYDTTPSLGATEPEEREFPSYSDYPTTIESEGDTTVPLWQQKPEEHDEDSTEKIPSSDYYTTQSKISDIDQNKWSTTTSSHRQYVGVTHSTPTDDFSQPEDTSTPTYGANNYYTTSYAKMEPMGHSTTTVLGEKEPEEEVFRSTTYPTVQGKHEDNVEETTWNQYYPTQSEMQETITDQHFTTDKISYPQFVGSHQSTLVDDSTPQGQLSENFETRKTTLHQPFVGKTSQSTNFNDFATSKDISDATTSYASMESSKYETTPLLGETEPEEREYTSYAPYPTTIGTEGNAVTDISSEKIPTSTYYTTKSEITDMGQNKWPMSGKSTNSHRQFVGITKSTPSSDFTKSSYTIPNSKYDTTTLLGATEPDVVEFTSNSPYSTTIQSDGDTSVSSWPQNDNERDEITTEKIPSTLHYSTYSEEAAADQNEWTKTGKMTSSQPQFVGVTQSTPIDDFSQFGVVSGATIGSDSHKSNSYATMEDSDQSTTSMLGAEEPEEEIFSSRSYPTIHSEEELKTTYSWPRENEEKQQDNVEGTTWNQYHTTQSGMQQTDANQHFTTDKYAYPQFVGSHQSTVVDSTTQQDQLRENFEPHETSSHQPSVDQIGQSETLNDFATSEDISDAATSYATMENSRYDTTPLLGETEPEERDFSSYSPYSSTIEAQGDTTASTWLQKTEERKGISTEKIPLTHYTTNSEMEGVDQNTWTKAGKTMTSHPQYLGITHTSPVNNFSPSGVVSSSTIGGNSHYSTSYATMDNSRFDTTPLLAATEPEENDFSSYSPISTTIGHEGDKTASPWQRYTEDHNEDNIEKIPVYHHTTNSEMAGMDQNEWTKSAKMTSSYPQFEGITQSTPVNDFSQTDLASSSTIGGNSHYTTSYATMENSKYDTTPLLGATEPEEQDFTSYSPYPTTIESEDDTTGSSWVQYTKNHNKDNIEKIPVYHHTTHSQIAGMDQNKWTKSGKATSSYPQFEGITQSTPVDDFSQTDLASSSTIGGNNHYTSSYATMENSKYDTTPLLGAIEPEEQDFTSYSPYPTTIESEDDTTASSWVQNTKQQNQMNTEKIPSSYYTTHSEMPGKDQNKWTQSVKTTTLGSYPQFVGITQSTPVHHFSQADVASRTTIGSNSHYTTSYATVEDMDHSTTSVLGAKEPEEEIFRSTTYPTIHDAEEMKTTSSWQRENTHNYQNNPEGTSWTPYYPTRSEVQDTSQGQHVTTQKNSYPQMVKSYQSTNDFSSSTGFNTQQYFTTDRNFHRQFSTEAPEDITLGNTNDQSTNWYYSTAHQKATSQSASRQFVASHHSTSSPRFKPDSGIKEETNAYFTSKAYDDNIAPVTGPDSYFEGEGIKNWNDFTSMSSDDFTVGDTNGDEGVKKPTTFESVVPQKEGWMTTEISPRPSTDYEVVGEEMPYKGSTVNEEFSEETTEDDFPPRQTTQRTYGNTNTFYPGQSYGGDFSTTPGGRTGKEEVGKPIYELGSSTPIADTHYFESHSVNPKILQSENKILETTSRGNLGIDYPVSSENSRFSGRITRPDITKVPFLDQSTTTYDRVGDTLNDMTTHENEADKKPLIYYGTTSPSEDYDYTDEYSTLEKSPTTEFSKYQDDASLQPLGNTLRDEPSLNQEVTASSINYDDYMSSEDDLPSGSSETIAPNSKTTSNLLRPSTTTRSVNYEDYEDSSSTQEDEWYPNYIQEQTTPNFDSSDEISSEDQLSPEDRDKLRTTVEKVVKDLISAKSDKPNEDGHTSPEVVGAPLLPGLPELPILKNLFSLPEVRNMAIGTVKGLMSEVSGVPQESSLGRLADHLIDSVLDGVVNNILPGPVTTTSSAIVDEHRYENGQWTVVPVTLVPKNDRVGQKHNDKVLGTSKDVVGQKPDDIVLSTIKDIVGRPGIGLQGARLPLVQNIIVRAVENTLRNAKHVVNHSVIWDTLNDVIARAEKSLLPTHGIAATVKTTTKSNVERITNSNMKTTTKSSGVKTPGGPYKIAPVIPVTEHFIKDGKWSEKQTILGAKRKNFESTTPTTCATDNERSSSSSSYETSAETENQYDYTTKAMDYALLGESEEDGGTREYDGTSGSSVAGITENIPKNINSLHDDEDGHDNSPIKYYSPNDRILSYIKNHRTTAGVLGSQERWHTTSGSLNTGSTEDYSTATETASNEVNENDDSVEFAQATQANDSGFSTESTESSVDGSSEESTSCTCADKKKMKNKEKVASALRGTTEASTEENIYPELTSTIYDSDEPEESNSRNHEEGKLLTTPQTRKNSGEELVSTESSELASTIHHLDVDHDGSNDYTTEEYVGNENPSVTEELDRNTADDSRKNSDETSYITTNSNEPTSISSMEEHTKNINTQITSTPVYVYGEPVGSTQFPEGSSRSDEENAESADEEIIGEAKATTTENIDQTSDEVEASDKITDLNETPTVSDVTGENLGAENHIDQSITTPVYVYGTPVDEMGPQGATNSDESTTQNLHQQFSETSTHHDFSDGVENHKYVGQSITTPVYVYGTPVDEMSPQGATNSEEITTQNLHQQFSETSTHHGFSDGVENHKYVDQSITTPVYVYGTPVDEMSPQGAPNSDESTTQNLHQQFSETSTHHDFSDRVENRKNVDQSITTPVYVYGTPVHEEGPQEATNSVESTTQNLDQQFSDSSEHRDLSDDTTTSTLTDSQENIGITQFPGSQTTESHSDTRSDGQPDEHSTEEYIKMENALTPENTDENTEDQVSTDTPKSTESFSDVTSEVLQADSRNVDNDFSTRVYVNGEPIQETTTQTLPRKLPKTLKSYVSGQEATTSSQSLIGAARRRTGRPRLPSLPRERLNRPRDDILKGSRPGGASNCVTPKYDPTYFGKISLNGVNPGGESISDLTNTDLFYVGDGVKIPLTIQRMPDGSFALSISEKICENFVKRKCPCCVPREGDIVEERRQSNEAEEYSVETTSKEDYNYDSFEPTESAEFQGKSKKRYVRSTSGSEVVVTSATPVKNFVKKYNLSLNLDKNHLATKIQRNDEDPEEMRSTRRKTRLSSSRDTKLRNLYGNNNEIQRDDSEEVENRIVDDSDSDTVSKESNSIRKAEYIFDTDTDDLIQSLLHIKDAPEDKRTEIVLNALDGLVNAGQNPDSVDHYTFGDAAQEIPSENENPWLGSDEYDLNEMENAMARYGYQKDNPILERIRFIKAQQNSHGQYKYQKNMDHRAKGKMNMLKTVLQWLREVFLETNANKKS